MTAYKGEIAIGTAFVGLVLIARLASGYLIEAGIFYYAIFTGLLGIPLALIFFKFRDAYNSFILLQFKLIGMIFTAPFSVSASRLRSLLAFRRWLIRQGFGVIQQVWHEEPWGRCFSGLGVTLLISQLFSVLYIKLPASQRNIENLPVILQALSRWWFDTMCAGLKWLKSRISGVDIEAARSLSMFVFIMASFILAIISLPSITGVGATLNSTLRDDLWLRPVWVYLLNQVLWLTGIAVGLTLVNVILICNAYVKRRIFGQSEATVIDSERQTTLLMIESKGCERRLML